MKIFGSTFVLLFSLLGVGALCAQSTVSVNPPGLFVEVEGSRLYYEECGKGVTTPNVKKRTLRLAEHLLQGMIDLRARGVRWSPR
jgi:hypothetical protein